MEYKKYKPTGIEWIDSIPSHWNLDRLKYVALVQPSNVDKKTNEGESSVLLCNYMDVYRNEFIDESISFMEATATENEIKKFKIEKGDVLVTKDSETPDDIANPACVKTDFENVICAYHLTQIRPNRKKLLGEYLLRLFQENKFKAQFEVAANGVTRYGLSVSAFTDAFVSLPPVEEQTTIANFLDNKTTQIDILITNKQKLIELLKEERVALINETVSGKGKNWEKRRLSTLGKFFKGRGIKKDETKGAGLPCIRYGEIYTKYDRIVYETVSFIDEETSKNSELIKKGDVLFAGSGETVEDIGKAIVYSGDSDAYAGGDVIVLRLQDALEPTYASYLLNASFVQHQKALAGKGEIIVHIYPKNIREITIPLPTRKEQIQIVNYLDKRTDEITSAISKIEQEIELMNEYRTALISEVVTGKIKVSE